MGTTLRAVTGALAVAAMAVAGCKAAAPGAGDAGVADAADARDSARADAPDGATGDVASDGPAPDAGSPCQLLATTCPNAQACYPYPFEALNPNLARCAFQGSGSQSIPCQSQLDCDGTSICVSPGMPDATCILRCASSGGVPVCPTGTTCHALMSYPGVGVCI